MYNKKNNSPKKLVLEEYRYCQYTNIGRNFISSEKKSTFL